jgi:hypothetical protein
MLNRALSDKRTTIVERWLQVVLDTYPEDTARSLRRERDRFANPAGYLFTHGIGALFDELVAGARDEQSSAILEDMLKLRALQDFTPSRAVGFVGSLKGLLRDLPGFELTSEQWMELDGRIDRLQMCAFDVYMRCRERVYEVRYNQLKKMNYTLLERANRMFGSSMAVSRDMTSDVSGDEESRGEDR